MKILITGVGGPTPRSFAIALTRYSSYKDYELVATDVNPMAVGLYQRELFHKSYVVPRATDQNYWLVIERIITENHIDVAVVLPELEVKVWSERLLKGDLPCKALIPDLALVDLLVDKAKMTSVLESSGLVPRSVEFNRAACDFPSISKALGLPFWIRSTSGTSGLGSLKVESEDALQNWIEINPLIDRFLASRFLSGRNLACKMLYFNGELMRTACAERVQYIMAKVAPSGITGNTSFGRLLNEPALVDRARQAMDILFTRTKATRHGFFTVDFKEDDQGAPFITEINVRHVAFTQCFAAAGANFAEDTLRLLDGDPTYIRSYSMYQFEPGLAFLRDVDVHPIVIKEDQLLKPDFSDSF